MVIMCLHIRQRSDLVTNARLLNFLSVLPSKKHEEAKSVCDEVDSLGGRVAGREEVLVGETTLCVLYCVHVNHIVSLYHAPNWQQPMHLYVDHSSLGLLMVIQVSCSGNTAIFQTYMQKCTHVYFTQGFMVEFSG